MKMIDLRISKKESTEISKPSKIDREPWPYGLRLRFEDEQIEKMPALSKLKKGEKVSISAIGEVVSTSKNDRIGESPRETVEIQLHKVGCASKEDYDEAFKEASEK